MASVKSPFFSKVKDLDAESVFNALCRVHGDTRPSDGPEAALAMFLREVGGGPASNGNHLPNAASPSVPAPSEGTEFPSPKKSSSAPAETAAASGREPLIDALLHTLDEYRALLKHYNRDFDAVFERRARGESEGDDETVHRLRGAQALLVKYPVAGQAVFAALVKEGRRFAQTAEGAEWMTRLVSSPLLAKARTLFEGVSGGMVSEHAGPLPSVYVDALVHALDRNLEGVLADVAGAKRAP